MPGDPLATWVVEFDGSAVKAAAPAVGAVVDGLHQADSVAKIAASSFAALGVAIPGASAILPLVSALASMKTAVDPIAPAMAITTDSVMKATEALSQYSNFGLTAAAHASIWATAETEAATAALAEYGGVAGIATVAADGTAIAITETALASGAAIPAVGGLTAAFAALNAVMIANPALAVAAAVGAITAAMGIFGRSSSTAAHASSGGQSQDLEGIWLRMQSSGWGEQLRGGSQNEVLSVLRSINNFVGQTASNPPLALQ